MTNNMNDQEQHSSEVASQFDSKTAELIEYYKKRDSKRDEKIDQMMSLLVNKCEQLEKRIEVSWRV